MFLISREKATCHLRKLTVLTIFQPFWHRFFWNCFRTSATLVALFKCTSRESFRRSEAWTFTTLEGWTRKAEPESEVLKKNTWLLAKTSSFKADWKTWRIKCTQPAFQSIYVCLFHIPENGSIKVSIIKELVYQCCGRGAKHWSRSVCSGALCCSDTVLALTGFDEIRLVSIYFENLFSIAW